MLVQGDTPIILGRDFRDVQPLFTLRARCRWWIRATPPPGFMRARPLMRCVTALSAAWGFMGRFLCGECGALPLRWWRVASAAVRGWYIFPHPA
ncbi:MAG: hypothetical protein U0074_08910 [Kouleothrix sp.]